MCLKKEILMKARLNLTIDEGLLEKAKHNAASRKSSVSNQIPASKSVIDMIQSLPKPDLETKGDLKKRYMEETCH